MRYPCKNTQYMKKSLPMLVTLIFMTSHSQAQPEPAAATWKTCFITAAKDYRLSSPASWKQELNDVLSAQKNLDPAGMQQIIYWNTGAPGYRWQEMMDKLWMTDTTNRGMLASML